MKRLILTAIIAMTSLAVADGSKEPELSPATKLEIEKSLRAFLADKTITSSQYNQSIAFLNNNQCKEVDRSLSPTEKSDFSESISRMPYLKNADVVESFKYHSWRILLIDSPDSEPGYFFYSSSPQSAKPVTVWGGINALPEGPDLVQWVTKNAPAIPKSLAQCFAWHVTFNRGQW